jgi:hypothetical protein
MPNFRTVWDAERDEIPERPAEPLVPSARPSKGIVAELVAGEPPQPSLPAGAVGLAFSGGGIRSATFNLGILQGLARAHLLPKIDYLSTVSGGGYIGSWLVSWIKRAGGIATVQQELGDFQAHYNDDGLIVEPPQVTFLRDYSNYMTPRLGIFGADTWAGIATYLRNVLLNQIILAAFLGAIIFLPWCLLATSHWISLRYTCLHNGYLGAGLAGALGAIALLIGVGFASAQTMRCSLTASPATAGDDQKKVIAWGVLPIFLSAILTMIGFWLTPDKEVKAWPVWYWPAIGAGFYGLAHIVGVLCRYQVLKSAHQSGIKFTRFQAVCIVISAAFAGAVGGFLLQLLEKVLVVWKFWHHGFAHAFTWGPALYIVAFLLVGTLHIGFLKALIQNEEQEWWGRTGGLLLIFLIAWTALFALTMFVPWILVSCGQWIRTEVGLATGWVLTTFFGVLSGKSSKTSGKKDGKQNQGLEILAVISPYVFVIGLFVLVSVGAFRLAEWKLVNSKPATTTTAAVAPCAAPKPAEEVKSQPLASGDVLTLVKTADAEGNSIEIVSGKVTLSRKPDGSTCAAATQEIFWTRVGALSVSSLSLWLWGKFAVLLVIAVGVAFRVDINLFSMNLLYRNRLVRCYLGASRPDTDRHPNPFTGFDPNDDISIADFIREKNYDGPYPIVCASLNITHGERLAWQERKAESFVFTPRYCGYEFPSMHDTNQARSPGGYHASDDYAYPRDPHDPFHAATGGVHLGTAVSISGAAASPNMGFHTSPPLAFLMTVFNVRLGWWLANSRYSNDELMIGRPEGGPPFSLFYLLNELLASTTDKSDYIYLSDGGHFENLGVYELVRRRCRYIIACDADADENVTFEDLGNAIRKCRSDFGVEISLNVTGMKPNKKSKLAQTHGVAGTIRYPPIPGDENPQPGRILYIKPTITKDVPRDVLAYRDSHPAFPYQTTADQWFDESQFESYRRLGLFSMQTLAGLTDTPPLELHSIEALFGNVDRINTPPSNAPPPASPITAPTPPTTLPPASGLDTH